MSFDESLGNVSEGSVEELKSPKAKKIFSKKSFKKGVANFARRASLGAFGSKTSESMAGEGQPKAKRRSFFGGTPTS